MDSLQEKKLFLLDMDGTIYLDHELFDGTIELLDYIKEIGGAYKFVTNNSSKSVDAYVEKLASLGIASLPSDFLTSTNATVLYLQKNYLSKKIYAFGTNSFKKQLRAGGLNIVDTLSDDIDCLVAGFDTELTFQKLEDACILLNRGVDFIATNPDWVCPTWYGYVPDCGSVCEMLFRATNRRPKVIGKPEPTMVELAIQNSSYTPEQTLVVGDRIYTDIACGVNAHVSTALLLSGETTQEVLDQSEMKPEFVFSNIAALYEAVKK